MSITIRIPRMLLTATGGVKSVATEGSTVGEVLKDLFIKHPDLEKRVVGTDGQVHKYLNVHVDQDDIRFTGNLTTPVRDGQEVSILAAVAGG